jgi:acyl-CoA synthetase (AMP-forming)/AMP-acid ligase II
MAPERILVVGDALGNKLTQFYGMVEAIPPVTVLTQADHAGARNGDRPHRLGSAGRAVLGAVLEVVDEAGAMVAPGTDGELVIAGDHVMAGYWGLDEATGKTIVDGRLHTGDMATMDEDGYVTIIDRKGDMIISGGYNVYPREVEDALAVHPAVAEVAVIGVPDPMWGQAVTAYIVARAGHKVLEAELLAHCAPRLASYKKPKRVVVVDELPKGSTGKIARKALRAQVYGAGSRMI